MLLQAVLHVHIFRRNKRLLESKILASLPYVSGLSYRVKTYQTRVIEAIHVSALRWVHALKNVASHLPRSERKIMAIEETKLKIRRRQFFVWSPIDVESKELLATYASYQRSSYTALLFVRMVLDTCMNKPFILVDGGPLYPCAFERCGLRWLHVTFDERNAIDMFYRTFRERTR